MKKVLGIIKKVVDIVLTIFVLLFVLVVCLQRFSNNEISLFSYRVFTVVSGSMKPEYDIGDVLISKEVDANKIKNGDDVSYLGKRRTFNGRTHELLRPNPSGLARLLFDSLSQRLLGR